MCTVTFLAQARGYVLGMNRDEQRTRVLGRPPSRWRAGKLAALAPSEPGGGTWAGVNETGAAWALINGYSVGRGRGATEAPAEGWRSRGEVVRNVLGLARRPDVEPVLAALPLSRVKPFRLIGVFPGAQQLVEWRWDGVGLVVLDHSWATATWISSGHDEPGAERLRREQFVRWASEADGGLGVEALRCLHASHRPGPGPYSHCVHRPDAVTVSYVEVEVSGREAAWSVVMRYRPGSPCEAAPLVELGLAAGGDLPGRGGRG